MSGMPSLHLQPAWFGAVMGTAAMSIVLNLQAHIFEQSLVEWFAVGFLWIATALALILWPRYFRRLARRHELREEIADPGHGAMLATLPAGLLVLAVAWGAIGSLTVPEPIALVIALVLVIVGTIIATGYSVIWAMSIQSREVGLERIHGGWMIPVVMPLLVPVALVPIMNYWPMSAMALLFVGFAFLGVGTLLFLGIFSLFIIRLATQPPLPNPMSPSLWIPLAPAGIFGVAIIRLTESAIAGGIVEPDLLWIALALAVMGIGFGLWWTIFAFMDLVRVRANGGIPFHVGWWGFVFPTAAMAISITLVGQLIDFPPIIGAVATLLVVGVWATVFIRTVRAVIFELRARRLVA